MAIILSGQNSSGKSELLSSVTSKNSVIGIQKFTISADESGRKSKTGNWNG